MAHKISTIKLASCKIFSFWHTLNFVLKRLEQSVSDMKTKLEKASEEFSRLTVAKDVELETLHQQEAKFRSELAQRKDDLERCDNTSLAFGWGVRSTNLPRLRGGEIHKSPSPSGWEGWDPQISLAFGGWDPQISLAFGGIHKSPSPSRDPQIPSPLYYLHILKIVHVASLDLYMSKDCYLLICFSSILCSEKIWT